MLKELDLLYLWHPCTQMKDHEKIPPNPHKKSTRSMALRF